MVRLMKILVLNSEQMTEHKKLYDLLLKSGDLFDVFPDAVGDWSQDKKGFIEIQDELDYLTNTPLEIDEEEQEDFD